MRGGWQGAKAISPDTSLKLSDGVHVRPVLEQMIQDDIESE